MKRLVIWLSALILAIATWIGLIGWIQPAIAVEPGVAGIGLCVASDVKIDLNNANMAAFTDCPGFYPSLAKSIVTHGPYVKVEDVLKIEGLSDMQKDLLKANLGHFMVAEATVPLEMRMPPKPVIR
ncbi:photosystem II complex extrinsic protein PsbU [Pseudanabaena sp. PCC 6802]|uniref:photosystem II complex extrinsic protein PsbU n=1 Tax=Pseudanabaena sp. PCC 6802 TaxID=118173 RepID=UPI00034C67B3|nr:photosystem II complex extrinsic protein PsbU [Pseudanabaena sp. PCC 6802]